MPPVRRQGEANIGPTISTGLAAGPSLKHAIVSGLHECFERDAFSIFWMNDLPPRRIALPSSSDETRVGKLFREHFVTPGYEYRAYDIGNDLGVPTAYVLLTCATSHGPIYVVGAAARLDRGQATLKALLEAVQGKSYVQWLMSQHAGWSPTADFSNVTDFCFSCIVYSVAQELTPHLLGVEQRVSSELPLEELPRASPVDAPTELRELVRRLAARDYEAIVVELTTPDVAPLGVRVVRVITPELQPLHADHRFPFLGGRRLYEVPARLGHGDVRTEDQLSPYPHPFP
jgi:ribosomal protein S12 methylthiotransferase accessory factor